MKLKKNILLKNFENSICILLTDYLSINEEIILKSSYELNNNRFKKIIFIGDKIKFNRVYQIVKKNLKKFEFNNIKFREDKPQMYTDAITRKAIELFKNKRFKFLINMPLNKKKYLKKKFVGFTEFFSYKIDKKNNQNMLLYNNKFAVCPLTTHIEIKKVAKQVNKENLSNAIKNIDNFYKNVLKKKIKIIVLGLNPHASKDMKDNNEDNKIITNIVKKFKKNGLNIQGPTSADTAFNGKNNNKVFLGMYHDQVLIPFKILNKFNGINITIGKKLIRLSPDHGTGEEIIGRRELVNNLSFLKCIEFCDTYLNA